MPQFETKAVYNCTNCYAVVSETAKSCPKCKAVFDYREDENGRRTNISDGSPYTGSRVRIPVKLIALVVFGVIGVIGWIGKQAFGG